MFSSIQQKSSSHSKRTPFTTQRRQSTPFFIQSKPKIGPANDSYEQEADRVADSVVSGEKNIAQTKGISHLQRKCSACEEEEAQAKFFSGVERVQKQEEEEEEAQPKRMAGAETLQQMEEEEEAAQPKIMDGAEIQRQAEEEEEPIQMKADAQGDNYSASGFYTQLDASKSGGSLLNRKVENEMSHSIGADFSSVRVHTDSRAAEMSQSIQAKAFTVGNHVYFNKGQYNPETSSGKHLLAHELTHTVQQGATKNSLVQRNSKPKTSKAPKPDPAKPSATSTSPPKNPLAKKIVELLKEQSTSKKLNTHFKSLGKALKGLALKASSTTQSGSERLSALNIPGAFESTSKEILADKDFQNLKKKIIAIIGTNDATALTTALAAAITVILADIPIKAKKVKQKLGKGFSVGGGFDFGSIQSLQFNELNAYAQYANKQFMAKLGGGVKKATNTGEYVGSGTGSIRLGNKLNNLTGSVAVNSKGEVVLAGKIQNAFDFGGGNKLLFSYKLQHEFASNETIYTQGVSGKFNLGYLESIKLGSEFQYTHGKGVTGAKGYLEYKKNEIRLRIEGNIAGLADDRAISPGKHVTFQAMLSIPLP